MKLVEITPDNNKTPNTVDTATVLAGLSKNRYIELGLSVVCVTCTEAAAVDVVSALVPDGDVNIEDGDVGSIYPIDDAVSLVIVMGLTTVGVRFVHEAVAAEVGTRDLDVDIDVVYMEVDISIGVVMFGECDVRGTVWVSE